MDLYAVFGNPVAQSLSPELHKLFAKQTKQDIDYIKIEAPLDGFINAAKGFIADGGKGFNVTLPFKFEAFQLVEHCSERARLAEAVNTVKVQVDGSLFGDNTDGIGLVKDIEQNQLFPLQGRKICLLGAGGAVHGVIKPILDCNPAEVVIANRTKSRAVILADKFNQFGTIMACGLDELTDQKFDLIINGTSASVLGKTINLPENLLTKHSCCYEMMYGKPTPFLQWAKTHGANRATDGLGMLVEQGAESFLLWRGIRPDTKPILITLRTATM